MKDEEIFYNYLCRFEKSSFNNYIVKLFQIFVLILCIGFLIYKNLLSDKLIPSLLFMIGEIILITIFILTLIPFVKSTKCFLDPKSEAIYSAYKKKAINGICITPYGFIFNLQDGSNQVIKMNESKRKSDFTLIIENLFNSDIIEKNRELIS